jgi:hypothetical protein
LDGQTIAMTFIMIVMESLYAEIEKASALHPASAAWAFFMREIVRLPCEMTPAVSQVIRLAKWKIAPDPVAAVRSDAIKAFRRAWPEPGVSIRANEMY